MLRKIFFALLLVTCTAEIASAQTPGPPMVLRWGDTVPTPLMPTSPFVLRQAGPATAETPAQAAPVTEAPTEATPAAPAAAAPAPEFVPSGVVEVGGNVQQVSRHYGNWSGEYAKGELQTDEANRWNVEMLNQKEFRDSGTYISGGNTHVFNDDWYSTVAVGAGNEAEFLPRYRIDGFLSRKWLEQRELVTTLGLGEYRAMDNHKDHSVFGGVAYYFPGMPWIAQAGIRYNNSHPGSVNSTSQFVALTEGENKDHFITARYGFGREAYQIIGLGNALSDFHSQDASLEWRQWVTDTQGFTLRGEHYHNPNYNRNGVSGGVFNEF